MCVQLKSRLDLPCFPALYVGTPCHRAPTALVSSQWVVIPREHYTTSTRTPIVGLLTTVAVQVPPIPDQSLVCVIILRSFAQVRFSETLHW